MASGICCSKSQTVAGQTLWAMSSKLMPIIDSPPNFLTELDFSVPGVRLYAINP